MTDKPLTAQEIKALKGETKVSRIPIKIVPTDPKRKPAWIKAKAPVSPEAIRLKALLREQKLNTICEEAACPNLGECFSHGTATFLIMGQICTRRCPFCDVAHGKPLALDPDEPKHLAETIAKMALKHVVITSVDRDDLRDGGAAHFIACIRAIRELSPQTQIEVLVPDFRGRKAIALDILSTAPPDIFNHNLETVPRLYRAVRPGSDYSWSLSLIQQFQQQHPRVPTKSGLMLGVGETIAEVEQVMHDLYEHGCQMLTLGQYLQPSRHHLAVERFVTPEEFEQLAVLGEKIGFNHVASGPMVRSSYHADLQAKGERVT